MPQRIQLRRTNGWRMPENTVKVARPGIFGNPWKIGNPGQLVLKTWPVTYNLPMPIDNTSSDPFIYIPVPVGRR